MLTVYLQENEINLTKITPISWKGSGNNFNPKDNIVNKYFFHIFFIQNFIDNFK